MTHRDVWKMTSTADCLISMFARVLPVLPDALARWLSVGDCRESADHDVRDVQDIQHSRDGDSDAYRRLIERHQDHVSSLIWRFSRDRQVHEELVQDVFVEAYLSLGSYRGDAPFEHWLSRIATRVGYRYWRKVAQRKRHEPLSMAEWEPATGDNSVLDTLEPSHAAALVHRLLAQLPLRDRLVLTLRYLDECDVDETARRTGWTKTMVKVQTLRARKKLRQLIEDSDTELIR